MSRQEPRAVTYALVKRAIDVVVALIGLIMLAPVFALVAVLVVFDLGFPPLFLQERTGLRGKRFRIVKFRTMREIRDAEGMPLPDAERLGRLGRALRSASIDELPELWNVLRGDMSLVGPRPLLPEYDVLYTARQARRLEVKPGITGLAQVSGRNLLTWEEKFDMDVAYVDSASLWTDFSILAKTVGVVLLRRGVTQNGEVTARRFEGTPQGSDEDR